MRSLALLAVIIASIVLLYKSHILTALANGYEYEYGEDYEEWSGELAEGLGEIAFNGAILLNAGFLAVKWLGLSRRFPALYRLALSIHEVSNIVLGAAALLHGALLIEYAGLVEYVLAILIIAILLSGIMLRYSRNRKLKALGRHIHLQRLLALLLLVIAVVHVVSVED